MVIVSLIPRILKYLRKWVRVSWLLLLHFFYAVGIMRSVRKFMLCGGHANELILFET